MYRWARQEHALGALHHQCERENPHPAAAPLAYDYFPVLLAGLSTRYFLCLEICLSILPTAGPLWDRLQVHSWGLWDSEICMQDYGGVPSGTSSVRVRGAGLGRERS